MKNCSVGAELFHADKQTDMMKFVVNFRNFSYAPKKHIFSISVSSTDWKGRQIHELGKNDNLEGNIFSKRFSDISNIAEYGGRSPVAGPVWPRGFQEV